MSPPCAESKLLHNGLDFAGCPPWPTNYVKFPYCYWTVIIIFCEFYLPIIFLAASINQRQSVLFRPHQALRPQKDPMTYRRFATPSSSDAPKMSRRWYPDTRPGFPIPHRKNLRKAVMPPITPR